MDTRASQRGNLKVPVFPPMETNAGVYLLSYPGLAYVGQSHVIRNRVCHHIRSLQLGKHHNAQLQAAFNEDGFYSLEFKVLQYFPDSTKRDAPELLDAEAAWAAKLRSDSTVPTRWRRGVFFLGRGQKFYRTRGPEQWDDIAFVRDQAERWCARLAELVRHQTRSLDEHTPQGARNRHLPCDF